MELESVQVYEFNGGDDVQLLIRKGMATYQPSTPELKEIANRANSHDALKETLRLKEEENKQLADEKEQLELALKSMPLIVFESSGVAGYHMNGDIADWEKFEEVEAAKALVEKFEEVEAAKALAEKLK